MLWRKIRGNAMHIFILTSLDGIARLNRRKEGMQFSVNMRQDMFPAEPDMRTNTSRVRPISFHGNKWGNLSPPRPDGTEAEGASCYKSLLSVCYVRARGHGF